MTLPWARAVEAAMTAAPTPAAALPTGATVAAAFSTPSASALPASLPRGAHLEAATTAASASTTTTSPTRSAAAVASKAADFVPASCCRQEEKDESVVEADILIVGTGLVGCLTAAALARRGVKVVQIDGKGIYGGVYRSLKLSELCDWVRAEGQERDTTPRCHSCTVTPSQVAASRAPATAPATGAASFAADSTPVREPTEATAAAAGAAAGEAAAGVLSSTAPALAQAAASPSEAIVSVTDRKVLVLPQSAASGNYELLQPQATTGKHHVDFKGASDAAARDCMYPQQASAPLAEADAVSRDVTASLKYPEWVCSFEESASAVMFSLRREWEDPARTYEQLTATGCWDTASQGDSQQGDVFSPLEASTVPQDTVKARAAWEDSEGIFFSSRSFSFFPFATDGKADRETERRSSIKTVSNSFREVLSHPGGECERYDGGGKVHAIAAAAHAAHDEERESSLASLAPGAAEARVAARTDAFAAQPLECKTFGTASTERFPIRMGPSSNSASVEGAPVTTKSGSSVVPAAEDEEAVKKTLLKCNRFSIDLVPRVLYSNSAITHILVTCGAAKYVEFRPIDTPVYVGEVDADISGIQEHASGGFRGDAGEEGAARQQNKKRRRLLSVVAQDRSEGKEKSGETTEEGVRDGKSNLEIGTGKEGNDVCGEEVSLVQMPLTRSAIFSSSLLSVQEKRLLMKFISNVAAPKLNNQFLSAARLWNAGKQVVNRAFGGDRSSAGAPPAAAARATPLAQTAASKGAAGTHGGAAVFCEAGSESLASSEDDVSNVFQQDPAKSDGTIDDMSWEEYLELHHLTEKLQRYLSYGVCVSDFPLRRRAPVHSQCQCTSSATVAKRCRTEEVATEGHDLRETRRRREDDNGRATLRPPTDECESSGGCLTSGGWRASEGRARLLAFVQSVGLYENHSGAWLYPLYGTGDLPQALARTASLSGTVYMLQAGLVELKIICQRSRFYASTSCFPHYSRCSMPAASSFSSSALSTEFPELRSTSSREGEPASICQCANGSAVAGKIKSSVGEPAVQIGCFCHDESVSFMSMFHTAVANAKALEAKLETGVTVRARLLLFEADALPPLHQRVRTHISSTVVAHPGGGYPPEPKSSCDALNGAPFVEAAAQRDEARKFPTSESSLEHSAKPLPTVSNAAEVPVHLLREMMGARNESSRALNNAVAAVAPRHPGGAVEALNEGTLAQWTNAPSPVYMGELLFPALRLRRARARGPCAASTEAERQRATEEDTVTSIRREVTAEEEGSSQRYSSLTGEERCTEDDQEKRHACFVDQRCPGTQRGVADGLSHTVQQTKKRYHERLAACGAPQSFGNYYTQASCHLIALCRRSVLNGSGFRMCVCSVRSKKTPTFRNTSSVERNGPHSSTVNLPNILGRFSTIKPGFASRTSADIASADGAQARVSSYARAAAGKGNQQGSSSKQRDCSTNVTVAPSADRVHFTSSTPSVENACNATPAPARHFASAGSPVSASVASTATKCTCTKSRSAKGPFKCTCAPGQPRILGEENTTGRASNARVAGGAHVDRTFSSGATRVLSAPSVQYAACGATSACETGHGGATTAWPVLVLQTDGTCGTTPADYVLLHLSHIDGPGVETCGCSFHEEPPRRRDDSTAKCGLVGSCESSIERYTTAAVAPTGAPSLGEARSGKATPVESEAGNGWCKKSESYPCAMLMYVLRRLLERGRHCEGAAQDCVFVCGYVLHTLRSDIQKWLQDWQSKRFRGALRRGGENREETGGARRGRVSAGKQLSLKEGLNPAVLTGDVRAPADAPGAATAVASGPDSSSPDVPEQCRIAAGEVFTEPFPFPDNGTVRKPAARHNESTPAAEETPPPDHVSVEKGSRSRSSATAEQCGFLSLPAVPSTPLSFLLQEPNASQEVVEMLLDQRIEVADLIPTHACQEAEEAAQELQRLSAPYEKLGEIVGAVL